MTVQPLPSGERFPSSGLERPVLHIVAWILGAVALFAAAIGAWMVLAAEDATLTVTLPPLIEDSWTAAELSEFWAPVLLIAGGVVTAVLFGLASLAGFRAIASRLLPSMELLLAVVGAGAIVAGVATVL